MAYRPTDQVRCLPYPWPLPDSEPEPTDLDDDVDWMTYSHLRLYDMVHQGVDLEAATEVAARWSRLGADLVEIGDELRQALVSAADGWQGVAAEEARQKVNHLASWTEETADGSAVVSGCVSEQADLISAAQHKMPEPPDVLLPPRWPQPMQPASEGTTPMSAGPALVADPDTDRQRVQELHKQAAEVLEQYQRGSRDLYTRVPAFTSPEPGVDIERHPDHPPGKPDPKPEPPREPEDERTTTSSTGPGTGAPSAPAAPAAGVGSGGGSGVPAPLPTGQHTGGGTEQYGPGTRAGAGGTSPVTQPAVSPAAAAGGRGAMGPGAVPMGAGAAGARQGVEDAEHRSPAYLEEDDDVWGSQAPVTPPVLGEQHPGNGGR